MKLLEEIRQSACVRCGVDSGPYAFCNDCGTDVGGSYGRLTELGIVPVC